MLPPGFAAPHPVQSMLLPPPVANEALPPSAKKVKVEDGYEEAAKPKVVAPSNALVTKAAAPVTPMPQDYVGSDQFQSWLKEVRVCESGARSERRTPLLHHCSSQRKAMWRENNYFKPGAGSRPKAVAPAAVASAIAKAEAPSYDGPVWIPVQAPPEAIKRERDGPHKKPRGRNRKGCTWNSHSGIWDPIPGWIDPPKGYTKASKAPKAPKVRARVGVSSEATKR